jgi:hypothetical protein
MAATDNDIIPGHMGHMQPAHTQGFLNLSSKRFPGTDLSFTTTNCKILPKMEGFVKILYNFFWKSRKNNKKTHFLNVYKNRSKISFLASKLQIFPPKSNISLHFHQMLGNDPHEKLIFRRPKPKI